MVDGHLEAGQVGVRQRRGVHRLGDHADHLAAGLQCPVGHVAHQPGLASAIDETDAPFGQQPAHLARCCFKFRVDAVRRTAVYTNGFHLYIMLF